MRDIRRVIIHCSATKPGVEVSAEDIRRWHVDRGWRTIGYHYVIQPDGEVELGRPINEIGAHARSNNKDSIGICYIGGLDEDGHPKDTLTSLQQAAIFLLCEGLNRVLQTRLELFGHNDMPNTTKYCPCFDVDWKFWDEILYLKEMEL